MQISIIFRWTSGLEYCAESLVGCRRSHWGKNHTFEVVFALCSKCNICKSSLFNVKVFNFYPIYLEHGLHRANRTLLNSSRPDNRKVWCVAHFFLIFSKWCTKLSKPCIKYHLFFLKVSQFSWNFLDILQLRHGWSLNTGTCKLSFEKLFMKVVW